MFKTCSLLVLPAVLGTVLLFESSRIAAAADAEKTASRWLVMEVGHAGNLVARLRVLKKASFGQQDWMVLELENQGKELIQLDHVEYCIQNCLRFDRRGREMCSGDLAQGNTSELFPEAWEGGRHVPVVLLPGIHLIAHPSDYSSALLGLPPREGWHLKASLRLSLGVEGQNRGKDPKYYPFQFEWLYPDAAGIKRMCGRLKSFLARPNDKFDHLAILGALLRVPEVAQSASGQELLAALENHHGQFSGGDTILAYLGEHRAADPVVVGDFQRRLNAGDPLVVVRLMRAWKMWSPTFAEPLLQIYEQDPLNNSDAIKIFAWHSQGKPADPAIARRLSTAWLKVARRIGQKPSELPLVELSEWSREVMMLGETRDLLMIPRLQVLLDDKTALCDETQFHYFIGGDDGSIPLTRVCHVALEAILTILDGIDLRVSHYSYIFFGGEDRKTRLKTAIKERDKAIVVLKRRLATVAQEVQALAETMGQVQSATDADEGKELSISAQVKRIAGVCILGLIVLFVFRWAFRKRRIRPT